MAKGVEDTAFYRYFRFVALNEVGGSPGRFSLPVDEFHAANLERARRFPRHLLASQTHDTKRSGDVRARLVALSWVPDEWEELVRAVEIPHEVHPNDAYLVLQTVVGAWPLTRERLDGYLEKALREGKQRSSWLDPDEAYEHRVQSFAWDQHARLAPFARWLAPLGAEIALAQTLLKLASPGVPDIYQGDEGWSFNLVDPDNRRPVDWAALAQERGNPKLDLVRAALAERIEGEYEPVETGEDVCAFTRGRHLVGVPIRRGARHEPPAGWRSVVPGLWTR
jgi:(1->4)-alpha-D-glucan 1-alpha-D-glucosylmutase